MYQPGGLIPGARKFYRWLLESGKPFVFLSNTGAKNAVGVQARFSTPTYLLDASPVPREHIFTAAEAQVDYMLSHVPPHAKLLVIAGGSGVWRDDLRARGGAAGAALFATWKVRTELSDEEAKEWAACSACSRRAKNVWVAFFTDGEISQQEGHAHERRGTADADSFSDWGFEVINTAGFLLSHGAQFIYTADDAYNPSADPKHPGMMFPLPGPGMFAEMMKKLMYPHGKEHIWCAGKGGNVGTDFMMEHAIRMLEKQGHSGERARIMMVGDRFDTDVRAGLSVGIRTCLVESGCHNVECQKHYRMDPAHYYAPNIADLVPAGAAVDGDGDGDGEDEDDEDSDDAATAPASALGRRDSLRASLRLRECRDAQLAHLAALRLLCNGRHRRQRRHRPRRAAQRVHRARHGVAAPRRERGASLPRHPRAHPPQAVPHARRQARPQRRHRHRHRRSRQRRQHRAMDYHHGGERGRRRRRR